MKKKLLSLTLCVCLSAAMVGCAAKDDTSKEKTKKEETANTTENAENEADKSEETSDEELIPMEDDHAEKLYEILMERNGNWAVSCSALEDYSSIALEVVEQVEVTDEVFQEEIDNLLTDYAYTFSGEVVSGQTVNIDYAGSLNGELFDNGADEHYDLTIGAGKFIDGFEEQLIGMKVGETKTINVTFPAEYPNNPDLAGKETQFEVTVNAIALEEGKSEFTDQWVSLFLGMNGGIITDATVQSFSDYYRNFLEETAASLRADNEKYAMADALLNLITVEDAPQEQIDFYKDMVLASVESNIYNQYGISIEEYITQADMSQEDFDAQVAEIADERLRYEYAIMCVGEEMKLAPTEEEYTAMLQSYAESSSLTVEQFREQFQPSYQMELFFATYEEKVLNKLLETANITDVPAETEETEEPAE